MELEVSENLPLKHEGKAKLSLCVLCGRVGGKGYSSIIPYSEVSGERVVGEGYSSAFHYSEVSGEPQAPSALPSRKESPIFIQ
jgi:hypothetical protein